MNIKRFTAMAMLLLSAAAGSYAQPDSTAAHQDSALEALAWRAQRFGEVIPQEKVYLHMDNTCYFLGDTIWYKAYTRQTNTGRPSTVSRILYVELLNQDGYLVERQIVDMLNGEGCGQFVLGDTALYAGYYELRAYTRWQLNWGEYQHTHKPGAKRWFFNDTMAREFFRDYEKLYSRVFAVYDRPRQAGVYAKDMTLRPLLRYFSKEQDPPSPQLTLYPEGGHLIAGVPCRVAFEAAMSNGQALDGTLSIDGTDISAQATHRGRGVFMLTPEAGWTYSATFTAPGGQTAKAKLPAAETDGVALAVLRQDSTVCISARPMGLAAEQPLGVTVMHEGMTECTEYIQPADTAWQLYLLADSLSAGVHQVTVFDAGGRVFADRLFFATGSEVLRPAVSIAGVQAMYQPFEQASLEVSAGGADSTTTLSIAVRDRAYDDETYDNASIMAEMLLSSEIRGFVPDAEWYFSSDDAQHRDALDLLMLTQGWRRFNWRDMAVSGLFELVHPAEHRQIITGAVHNYEGVQREDYLRMRDNMEHYVFMGKYENLPTLTMQYNELIHDLQEDIGAPTSDGYRRRRHASHDRTARMDSIAGLDADMRERMAQDGDKLKNEVLVHAEFLRPLEKQFVVGEVATEEGRFTIQLPRFYDECLFHIAAADTTKWSKRQLKRRRKYEHIWVMPKEEENPEFYIRLSFPYPRFVKPYTFYQQSQAVTEPNSEQGYRYDMADPHQTGVRTLPEVDINHRSTGLRNWRYARPAMILDAYDAFNAVCDAGLIDGWMNGVSTFAYALQLWLVADMGLYEDGADLQGKHARFPEVRREGLDRDMVLTERNKYNYLSNLDRVELYTDYSPRLEGSNRYHVENSPVTTVSFHRYADEGRRNSYRDRFIYLQGINPPAEFYHPNYSRELPDSLPADYRRTLYWNPNLKLDANGHARISFYTGSHPATITVDVNGQTSTGRLLNN